MDGRSSDLEAGKPPQPITFEAILPAAMAIRAEEAGVKRAATDPVTRLVLSVLAGAFVSFGGEDNDPYRFEELLANGGTKSYAGGWAALGGHRHIVVLPAWPNPDGFLTRLQRLGLK